MKAPNLPLREARRLLVLTVGLLPTRVKCGSLAFRYSSMTFTRSNSSSQNRDQIQLVIDGRIPAPGGLVGGPHGIQKVQVLLNTPLGLGTASQTIDTTVNNRRFAHVFEDTVLQSTRSAQDLGHAICDRFLASSRDIKRCTVHVQYLPRAGADVSLLTNNFSIEMLYKSLSVSKWTAMEAEHGRIPATVTNQREITETEWRMSFPLDAPSAYGRNNTTRLRVWLYRENQGTTIPCSTPSPPAPKLKGLSSQALGVATVPDPGALFEIHDQLAILAKTTPFSTPDALASYLADEAYAISDAKYHDITRVVIKITRIIAGRRVGRAAVVIVRHRSDLSRPANKQLAALEAQGKHRAIVALGANIGDRIGNVEEACRAMDTRSIKVIKTSCLYETDAMYVLDQDSFINGACEVSDHPIDKNTTINGPFLHARRVRNRCMRTFTI